MESDLGKLFVGGISWDTDEERLKEYFGNYGEVVEAVIMRDRATGRARGFGFVVFTDPVVAERVTRDKHMIDGRSVEAKKAVPREDQQHLLLNSRGASGSSIPGSPSPGGRTKKIFVGGLASNVTESDFKNYFDQFGNITDVVVMYDHNTQRPRGFGFITYDSEEAVDRVLHKTFHDLNGKMVEVKRAVPKELSPATPNNSSRSPLPLIGGYNYNLTRVNNILNSYSPAGFNFNLASLNGSGYRVRMDGGPSPISMVRGYSASGLGLGLGLDQGVVGPGFTGGSNLSLGYGRVASPYNNRGGNSGRYNTPIGYQGSENRRTNDFRSSLWGNGNTTNPVNLGNYLGTGSGSFGGVSYGNGVNWGGPAPMSLGLGQGGGYGSGDSSSFGLGGDGGGRNFGSQTTSNSFAAASGNLDDGNSYGGDLYRDASSVYGGSNWLSGAAPEMNGPGSFGYGLGSIASDVTTRGSEGFVGSYNNTTGTEPNRGIAA